MRNNKNDVNNKNKKWHDVITFDRVVSLIQTSVTLGLFIYAIRHSNSAQESAAAAINSFKLSVKKFEIQNTPYLTITTIDSMNFAPNEPLFMRFKLVNLNSSGVIQIDSIRGAFTYDLHGKSLNNISEIEHILFYGNELEQNKCLRFE